MKLTVIGLPVPQGSKSAHPFRRKDGSLGVAVHEGGKAAKLKDWRASIASAAQLWIEQNGMPTPLNGPLALEVIFELPRPKSAPKRVLYPSTKPDLSKLIRAVEDALTGIAYVDDARIVKLLVGKVFASGPPCVKILLLPIDEYLNPYRGMFDASKTLHDKPRVEELWGGLARAE